MLGCTYIWKFLFLIISYSQRLSEISDISKLFTSFISENALCSQYLPCLGIHSTSCLGFFSFQDIYADIPVKSPFHNQVLFVNILQLSHVARMGVLYYIVKNTILIITLKKISQDFDCSFIIRKKFIHVKFCRLNLIEILVQYLYTDIEGRPACLSI